MRFPPEHETRDERRLRLKRLRYQLDPTGTRRSNRRSYRKHRDKHLAKMAEYRAKHPPKNTPARQRYMRLWRLENRERNNAYQREYRRARG